MDADDAHGFVPVSMPEDGEAPDIPDTEAEELQEQDSGSAVAQDEGKENEPVVAPEEDATNDEPEAAPVIEDAVPARPERLYFVRLPKPDLCDDDLAIEKVKTEFNSMKEGCDLLLGTLKVERVKQDEAKREFEAADLVFQESRAAQEKWREQLEPLRNANRVVTDQRNQMKDNFRELSARTEEELDKMIEEVEFSLNHETLNIHEEKQLIKQLKTLEQSRPRVRSAQAAYVQLEQSKEHLDDFRQHKMELEKKLDMIRAEVTEAKDIKSARYDALKSIRQVANQLAEELTAMRANKDAKWEELNRLRDARKAKLDTYYENRRFSQSVRTLLNKGPEGLEEAREQCASVNERLISLIADDTEFRCDYFAQWELQRPYSVTIAELALDSAPTKKAAPKASTNGAMASGKTKAQDIIKALMAEADAELGKSAVPTTASSARTLMPSSGVNTTAAAAPVVKPKPKAKAAADKIKAASRESEADGVFEEFVLPTRELAASVSTAQQKADVREEQRLKAAEADERKKKREEAKAKKAGKVSELAKLKEEAEERRAEMERDRIRREADEQRRRDAKKKETLKRKGVEKAAKVAQAKEVASAKKRPVKLTAVGQAQKYAKDHQVALALGGVVAALAVIIYMMVTF